MHRERLLAEQARGDRRARVEGAVLERVLHARHRTRVRPSRARHPPQRARQAAQAAAPPAQPRPPRRSGAPDQGRSVAPRALVQHRDDRARRCARDQCQCANPASSGSSPSSSRNSPSPVQPASGCVIADFDPRARRDRMPAVPPAAIEREGGRADHASGLHAHACRAPDGQRRARSRRCRSPACRRPS